MSLRCMLCGKPLESGDKMVVYTKATHSEMNETSVGKQIGAVHEDPCFDQATSSPTTVLNRIKRLAKSQKAKAAQK